MRLRARLFVTVPMAWRFAAPPSTGLMRAVVVPQDHRETHGFNPASFMCGGRQLRTPCRPKLSPSKGTV